jgi:hypothetical protein
MMEQREALDQYRRLVREKPEEKDAARKSFYDHFQIDPEGFSQPKRTDFQKQAASRKLGIEVEQHAATQEQEIGNAKAKAVGDVATALPVAATLATGGLAAPLAAAVMGGAGVQAGLYREAAKVVFGASDVADSSPQKVAKNLSVDFLMNAGAQAAVTAGSALLAAGGQKVLMPLVARAASKVDAGKTILGKYGTNLMNEIRNLESSAAGKVAPSGAGELALPQALNIPSKVKVDINKELATFEARLAARGTGQSNAFKERAAGLSEKLNAWDGSLSQLVEIKGDLSQAAFKKSGLNFEEQNALKEFASGVDRKLSQKFSEIGGKELYDGFKEVQNQLHRFDAGVELAGSTLKHMANRFGYAAAGGVYGYQHEGVGGAAKGAVAGAVAGVAMRGAAEKGAPWLLEKLLGDKVTAPVAKRAIGQMMVGDTKGAVSLFSKAATTVGADKVLKSWFEEEKQPTMGSVVNPEQGKQ